MGSSSWAGSLVRRKEAREGDNLEGEEKERKSVHMQGDRRCRERERPNVWIRKKGKNFWGEGKASPWARKSD